MEKVQYLFFSVSICLGDTVLFYQHCYLSLVSVIGDYPGTCNSFPIGMIAMKHLRLESGQSPTQVSLVMISGATENQHCFFPSEFGKWLWRNCELENTIRKCGLMDKSENFFG